MRLITRSRHGIYNYIHVINLRIYIYIIYILKIAPRNSITTKTWSICIVIAKQHTQMHYGNASNDEPQGHSRQNNQIQLELQAFNQSISINSKTRISGTRNAQKSPGWWKLTSLPFATQNTGISIDCYETDTTHKKNVTTVLCIYCHVKFSYGK
jgi:hypothetical protein